LWLGRTTTDDQLSCSGCVVLLSAGAQDEMWPLWLVGESIGRCSWSRHRVGQLVTCCRSIKALARWRRCLSTETSLKFRILERPSSRELFIQVCFILVLCDFRVSFPMGHNFEFCDVYMYNSIHVCHISYQISPIRVYPIQQCGT